MSAPKKYEITTRKVRDRQALPYEESVKGLTGHVLRRTGAQFMARMGVEYYKIQLLCRSGSDSDTAISAKCR